ncbi:hypothetical protein JCGZ_08125 [Jatropha curcas]|uniref:Uncharacterized protein n=1 Tax=Jatropha curcas TaxID=180498 RepID=A0A067KYB3_JATCU|nr:uncharacterized protein LOC105635404 [Jatropha curcas]KDP36834.1 hypothetical protein JCGZ_08125 [Jatropha curcas]
MSAFVQISKTTSHVRSSSLPSKTHPLAASVEEQLIRLKASESVCYKLSGLKYLYERVDDFLPLAQQAFARQHQDKCLEEMVDGSLRLLDMCSATRDVLSQMKECVQQLESSLRRKRGADSSMQNEVHVYMNSRKRLNKVISKCFGNLKKMESNCSKLPLDKDSELAIAVRMLKEVEEICLTVFGSLLSTIFGPKARSRTGKWSIVSKLLEPKQISCQGQDDSIEVEKIETELLAMIGKTLNIVEMENVMKGLEALESNFKQMEEELECVYRQLLKNRVSLLNMLNY